MEDNIAELSEVEAGDRARTGDTRLGRPMLYQLSYARLVLLG
jgi:hypothetical protein